MVSVYQSLSHDDQRKVMFTGTVFTITTLVQDLTGGEFEKNLASLKLVARRQGLATICSVA